MVLGEFVVIVTSSLFGGQVRHSLRLRHVEHVVGQLAQAEVSGSKNCPDWHGKIHSPRLFNVGDNCPES